MADIPSPKSCDCFVVVPECSSGLPVCFGKDSDRPAMEEHEVVYLPAKVCDPDSHVKCTYIEIPQVPETFAVVLSKPRWMWGCEMGANEYGLVGGNEAVQTRCGRREAYIDRGSIKCRPHPCSEPRLLGMDLVRLALERSRSARDAVHVVTGLLESHGQGGDCSEEKREWFYENSFMFADAAEAFVIDTAGPFMWAVEHVTSGCTRHITNTISIRHNIFALHGGLKNHCKEKGWWDGVEPFDFKAALGEVSTPRGREIEGPKLLERISTSVSSGKICTGEQLAQQMMTVLRDDAVCFRDRSAYMTTGSQVSVLHKGGEESTSRPPASHFFTCSSDPSVSSYKHFGFNSALEGAEDDVGHLSLELWRLREGYAADGIHVPILKDRLCTPTTGEAIPSLVSLLRDELDLLRSSASRNMEHDAGNSSRHPRRSAGLRCVTHEGILRGVPSTQASSVSATPSRVRRSKEKQQERFRGRLSAAPKRRSRSPLSEFYAENSVRGVFEKFDTDHDGMISKDDLAQVLIELDKTYFTVERVSCLMRAMDTDRDGNIAYPEFLSWVFSAEAGVSAIRLMNGLVPMSEPACRLRRCQGRGGCQCTMIACSVCKGRAKAGASGKCQRCAAIEAAELEESGLPRKPRLIVFDLDACLWTPEMYELHEAPSEYDSKRAGVVAGDALVKLLPGALIVLRKLVMDASLREIQIAVASSTAKPDWAHTCLDQVLVDEKGLTLGRLVQHREIYPKCKGLHHFPALHEKTNVPFSDMLFFDDCTYSDNCGDVASCCPGVLCVRTPDGLTEELFLKGLEAFARGAQGVL